MFGSKSINFIDDFDEYFIIDIEPQGRVEGVASALEVPVCPYICLRGGAVEIVDIE